MQPIYFTVAYFASSAPISYRSINLGHCTYGFVLSWYYFLIHFHHYLELKRSRIAKFLAINSSQRSWPDEFIEFSAFWLIIELLAFTCVLLMLLLIIEKDLFCILMLLLRIFVSVINLIIWWYIIISYCIFV